jgi:hypothetical protein
MDAFHTAFFTGRVCTCCNRPPDTILGLSEVFLDSVETYHTDYSTAKLIHEMLYSLVSVETAKAFKPTVTLDTVRSNLTDVLLVLKCYIALEDDDANGNAVVLRDLIESVMN